MERVPNRLGVEVIVDFAHTPEALENVLSTLQEVKNKRIITVFGCGGDRDREKRAPMASIIEKRSDVAKGSLLYERCQSYLEKL